ncbi:MAG: Do family serine endopeptidase [Candidatus Aminicenantes bacterium]|jgi:Do/DeqQ family serine protease
MKKTLIISTISFFLGMVIAGMIFIYSPEKNYPDSLAEAQQAPVLSSNLYASPSVQAKEDLDFVTIAEKAAPACVSVIAERVETRSVRGFFDDSPFDFWDRFFFGEPRGRDREQEFRSTSQGTGFFISQDGYIVTNNHIVESAIKVDIISLSGEDYEAEIVGTDPRTDLALLKVKGKNLPYLELGDSSKLKVGEWVLAVGNPLGLSHTVTAGIVSAKGRQLVGGGGVPDYQDFIQTDASINRGNSGGPLINMQGVVVGINSMIISPSGGNIGIGLSIPTSLAKGVIEQLKEKGRVVRGYLGVTIYPVTEDYVKLLKLKSKKGAVVNTVEPGTPAEKAGLKPYDVIIALNGAPIQDNTDVRFKIADIEPGTEVELTIIRDGKEEKLKVKITELDTEPETSQKVSPEKDIGITVQEMTERIARRYGFKTEEGLIITEVKQYSEADRRGLEKYDIIIEVNRKPVRRVNDLEKAIKNTDPGEPIMLRIVRERNGQTQESIVTLRIPE